MSSNPPQSDSNDITKITEYKIFCDARKCNKIATCCLKINYIKYPCWLCNDHVQHLKKQGLIESTISKIEKGDES